ncbi:unnamed protein product [Caenorhabditis auriculariae]|uniref:SWI/SNF-related matrix-associated actin-dependent regulator of chromatin subfamily A containing DEAD/H box 1 homolog n=1 Tax=Caenorhabditis auriculariae TaxID=2777116 RepID=A0A8S1HMV2_9PELO|nr:unnamed protein product [Caenorhabditis auriculariae]
MSTCKFDSGGKVRVAHQASAASSLLKQSIESKRLALSKIANSLNGSAKKGHPQINAKRSLASKPKKRKTSSDDDDDDEFVVEDEEEEEGEDEFRDDDDDFEEEEGPKKRKVPAKKFTSPNGKTASAQPSIVKKKEFTLSESSDEDDWKGKPRLDESHSTAMKTRVTEKKNQKESRRKAVIESDENDEFIDDDSDIEPDISRKKQTLKSEKKKAANQVKRKKGESDDEWEEFVEEDDDELGRAEDAETPSDDSDAEERNREKRRTRETPTTRSCREFFNGATLEELLATPRVNEKIAEVIMKKRPFENFADLEDGIGAVPRGKQALEAYIEHLENRGVLEKILDDCKDHAETVARDFERMTAGPLSLPLLKEDCTLHDYQKVGVKWLIMMYKKDLNCILGDEMGLGKTIQIISFLSYLKATDVPGPHLIVVPSSTIENWMNELQKWCPKLKLLTYYGNQDERKHLRHKVKKQKETTDIVLTTYNMISSKTDDRKFFKNFSMNYVIYDEGHMLKNCASERYRNLMKVRGKRKILLTGTPLQNNLIELISLMYFVLTKVFNRYCEDITQLLSHFKQQGPALEAGNAVLYQKDRIEQAKSILQPYILRRLKTQALGNLPTKTEKVLEVDLTSEQQELYDTVLESVRNDDYYGGNSYGALMRLRQAANHPLLRRSHYNEFKLDKIAKTLCSKEKPYETKKWEDVADDISFLSDFQIHQLCEKFRSTQKFLLDEQLALHSGKCKQLDKMLPEIAKLGDKVLIFSQFTSMLDILEVYLHIRGYSFKRLDGSTPVMDRQEMINEFNTSSSSELFIFLLSTKAGGLGINLTSANHIIIHDIDFNPYNDKQAEDRCHRMGQKKEVHVTRLISKDTVEVGMHMVAKKKLQLEKQVTGGIKGQLEEDDEDSRGSKAEVTENNGEEKLDEKTLNNLLSGALRRRSLCEAEKETSPSDSPTSSKNKKSKARK